MDAIKKIRGRRKRRMKKHAQADNKYVQLVTELKRILKQAGIPKETVVIGGGGLLGAMNMKNVGSLDVQIPEKGFQKITRYPGARIGRSSSGSPKVTIRTPYGEITAFTSRWLVSGRDFAASATTKKYRGMQHWDLPTTLDWKRRAGRKKSGGPTLLKKANEGEVARVFKGQRFSDKDIALGPRNEGWQVLKSEFKDGPGGVKIEKTTRIRSFGRLKKTAFLHGFSDELEKKGFTLIEALVAGTGAALGGHALYKYLKKKREKKKGQTKKASFLDKFAARAKMLIEPSPKKSPVLEKNPFLRVESKRRLVAGKSRTKKVPKVRGLLSGSAQFAMPTKSRKEAS